MFENHTNVSISIYGFVSFLCLLLSLSLLSSSKALVRTSGSGGYRPRVVVMEFSVQHRWIHQKRRPST
ncbi:hypothetical protein BDQ12DRAFT_215056 [Crucibulum laeve]|uniref:Uncharacterized protein n=1 Tax=Crucibulum laeve TaxID=68775 RepID=A0A5C3LW79_9AGAR|nr:hypothetical protein BDQ12DRAFT_215056 [Crucibulum laeve]